MMKRTTVKRLVNICVAYDSFTQYIEDGRQQTTAERRNDELTKEFVRIMAEEGISVKYIPSDFENVYGDKLITKIEKWLAENGVEVEPKRVWTEEEIRNLVQTNDKVLYGALRKLYAQQTADEQADGDTIHHNGVGFNGADAKIMSSFAQFLAKTGFLTTKQKAVARRKLVKYNRQLTRLANA